MENSSFDGLEHLEDSSERGGSSVVSESSSFSLAGPTSHNAYSFTPVDDVNPLRKEHKEKKHKKGDKEKKSKKKHKHRD